MTEENDDAELPDEPYEAVELQLAERGADLWLVLEAAQYARILIREEPETIERAAAVDTFAQAFSRYTESWEDTPVHNRSAVLEALGAHLETLRTLGLQVHWAVVEHSYETSDPDTSTIPLAIVSVTPDSSPTIHVAVPDDFDLTADDWHSPD